MKNTIVSYVHRGQRIGQGLILLAAQFLLLSEAHAAIDLSGGASDIVNKIIYPLFDAMFMVLIAVSVIMVLWAAYLFVIAQDDAEKVTKARKTITYAAVAVVVALIAKGFPLLISSVFGGGGGVLPSRTTIPPYGTLPGS